LRSYQTEIDRHKLFVICSSYGIIPVEILPKYFSKRYQSAEKQIQMWKDFNMGFIFKKFIYACASLHPGRMSKILVDAKLALLTSDVFLSPLVFPEQKGAVCGVPVNEISHSMLENGWNRNASEYFRDNFRYFRYFYSDKVKLS